jgi:hypothetical protein
MRPITVSPAFESFGAAHATRIGRVILQPGRDLNLSIYDIRRRGLVPGEFAN